MRFRKTLWFSIALFVMTTVAIAVNSQLGAQGISPLDFNPNQPSDYPNLTEIDIAIEGIGDFGIVHMLEGIDNSTTVEIGNNFDVTPVSTRYERLVFHGVFSNDIRDWRQDVIDGDVDERDIELFVRNSSGRRVLTIEFFNCVPVRFSLPPFATDGSTQYIERVEFIYETFEIRDT